MMSFSNNTAMTPTSAMAFEKANAQRFHYDPYAARVFVEEQQMQERLPSMLMEDNEAMDDEPAFSVAAEPPKGTLHAAALWDRVTFVPYPNEEFVMPEDTVVPAPGEEMVRAFVGQLPYFVTDMQLAWLCYTFGFGNVVVRPERIMKKLPSGDRMPTGCLHVLATRGAMEMLGKGMHKRLLIDDTGVWVAQSVEEAMVLEKYVGAMKADRALRPHGRPYDTVVIQHATSTYVARPSRRDF